MKDAQETDSSNIWTVIKLNTGLLNDQAQFNLAAKTILNLHTAQIRQLIQAEPSFTAMPKDTTTVNSVPTYSRGTVQ